MSAVSSRAEAARPACAAICGRPRPSDGAGQTLGVCHAVGLPAFAPSTCCSMTAAGRVLIEEPPCKDPGQDATPATGQTCSQGVELPLQGMQLSWPRAGLACPARCAIKTAVWLAQYMLCLPASRNCSVRSQTSALALLSPLTIRSATPGSSCHRLAVRPAGKPRLGACHL